MKKKILALCLVVALVAVAAIGGSLAYFTDTDAKNNVFTTGNVDIKLDEKFGDNDPSTPEKLTPATGSAQDGTLKNGVTKEVTVENIGSEDAYVRVHIAIPSILDNGDPDFDAGKNTLHFNYSKDSIGAGKWDWNKTYDGTSFDGDWNYYTTTIDGIDYNVYVVTYLTALKKGQTTPEKAIYQVYLDSNTSQEAIAKYKEVLGENWQIKVLAEGTQAAGFDDAYTALNTSFGVPGTYQLDWSKAVDQ